MTVPLDLHSSFTTRGCCLDFQSSVTTRECCLEFHSSVTTRGCCFCSSNSTSMFLYLKSRDDKPINFISEFVDYTFLFFIFLHCTLRLIKILIQRLNYYLLTLPVFSGVRVTRSLVFCVMFCRSLFVFLSFFFWPLCCLSCFDLRILITPLVSSNFSC